MTEHATAGEALVEIGMPRLSDSMEEATVLAWLKQPGDRIAKGEPLVEVETDKATVVYEAELDGVVEELVVEEGTTVELGALIARIRPDDPVAARSPQAPGRSGAGVATASAVARSDVPRPARADRARATPAARRLAAELGVALEQIEGTGPGGRISVSDVEAAAGHAGAADSDGRGEGIEVAHNPTQRTIATRMAESRASIPEFTLEVEIATGAASALREELAEQGRRPVPSLNDFVVRAVALALRDYPALNASFEPGRVVRHGRINVGVAVDVDDVLLVPVLRDADRLSLLELAAEARRLVDGAQARSLAPEEYANGTFTVSNLGMLGVRRFHAVINPPQAAILAVGAAEPRPVVAADGEIVARTSMDVALSCDHRVVYGAEAARFLARVRELLEAPAALVGEA